MLQRGLRSIATLVLLVLVLAGVTWSTLALWFDEPNSRPLAATLSVAIAATSLILATRRQSFLRGRLAALLPVLVVVFGWISLAPTNSRDGTPDVARPARRYRRPVRDDPKRAKF
jgi:hypothetical protein